MKLKFWVDEMMVKRVKSFFFLLLLLLLASECTQAKNAL